MFHMLNEQQQQFRQEVRKFVAREVAPTVCEMDRTGSYPLELMRRCADLNLTGILFPESYGGLGLGLTEYALASEEISRATQTLAVTLYATTVTHLAVLLSGNDEQRQRYVARGVSGDSIAAFACTEPAGVFNFPAHTTVARRDGDHWRISGTKIFITNAQIADLYLVFCRVDNSPLPTIFIVDKNSPGLTFGKIDKKLGWNGSNTGTVILDDVRVPASNLFGEFHKGVESLQTVINIGSVVIGAMCVGAAAGVFAKTLDYVKQRNLLGRNVIDNQSVSEAIARMAMDIETSRALVYKTAAMIDASGRYPLPGTPEVFLTSACKVQPPEMASRVCDMAIQLHGGHGYTDEMDIHRYWRDTRVCQIGEGPTYLHLENMANALRQFDLI